MKSTSPFGILTEAKICRQRKVKRQQKLSRQAQAADLSEPAQWAAEHAIRQRYGRVMAESWRKPA